MTLLLSLNSTLKNISKLFPKNSNQLPVCFISKVRPIQEIPAAVETDKDIGATEYLNNHQGFSGILRYRYSDFIVNEICKNREIVRLTNLGFCIETLNQFFELTQRLDEEGTNSLTEAIDQKISGEMEINVSSLGHDEAEQLCESLRRLVPKSEVYKKNTDSGYTLVLDACKPDYYTNFVLYKENMASLDTLMLITKTLRIKAAHITVAGWKDKRCMSSQRVCVKNISAEELLNLNRKLYGVKIGNIFYDSKPLSLGDHYGNHFTIVLREISANNETINTALQSFSDNGFINYFGLQRFGKNDLPTMAVGMKMLAGDWKSAVEMVIKPTSQKGYTDVLKCREVWRKTRDPKQSLSHLNNKFSRLGLILKGLQKNGGDYRKAFEFVPLNITKFYLFSYCSYIWNKVVSRRLREFGTSPIVGDLFLPGHIGKPGKENDQFIQVVTQEILDKGKVNMYNIILPLPGCKMNLPQNVVADWYHELLEKDGISFSSFQFENPRYDIPGDYRHLLRKPENVSWSILNYSNPDDILLNSDYDKLLGGNENKEHSGERKALRMEFSLTSSSYATSALREIMQTCITGIS